MRSIIIILALFMISNSFAKTGNELLESCGKSDRHKDDYSLYEDLRCSNYIDGAIDATYVALNALEREQLFCFNESVTNGQVKAVVTKYLKENPEQLHFSAASIVVSSLVKSFPCN